MSVAHKEKQVDLLCMARYLTVYLVQSLFKQSMPPLNKSPWMALWKESLGFQSCNAFCACLSRLVRSQFEESAFGLGMNRKMKEPPLSFHPPYKTCFCYCFVPSIFVVVQSLYRLFLDTLWSMGNFPVFVSPHKKMRYFARWTHVFSFYLKVKSTVILTRPLQVPGTRERGIQRAGFSAEGTEFTALGQDKTHSKVWRDALFLWQNAASEEVVWSVVKWRLLWDKFLISLESKWGKLIRRPLTQISTFWAFHFGVSWRKFQQQHSDPYQWRKRIWSKDLKVLNTATLGF